MEEKYYTFDEETKTLIIKEPVYKITKIKDYGWKGWKLYIGAGFSVYCLKLEEEIKNLKLPSTIRHIDIEAFAYCINLENVEFENSNNHIIIDEAAFRGCRNLLSVKWNGAKNVSLRNNVFIDCWNLEEIQIPKNLQTIEERIFAGCEKLKKIYVPRNLERTIHGINFLLQAGNNAQIVIVEDDFDLYKNDSNSEHILQKEVPKTKVSFSKNNSYCGCIRENLLRNKRKF